MDARSTSLGEFLKAVLRGSAKMLGCSSTNLILINERTGEIFIRLGAMATSFPVLEQLEEVMGGAFRKINFSTDQAADSLIVRSWREQAILETSSLDVLVGSAIPPVALEQMNLLIGEHCFICVPALSGARNYGVVLFEKEGARPFSRQQCEVALRCARRIGETLENDLVSQGQVLISGSSRTDQMHLLFDDEGELVGQGPEPSSPQLRAFLAEQGAVQALGRKARELIKQDPAGETVELWPRPRVSVLLSRLRMGGRSIGHCVLVTHATAADQALESQLLNLTLGAPAPAIFLDPGRLVTSCNGAAEKLLGYSSGELTGRPLSRLFHKPEEIKLMLDRHLLDPSTHISEERATVLERDGGLIPARVEAMMLADEMHQGVGFMVLIRTEPRDSREATERLVRQERLATMGELAAQLAHELRNPLVAIGATLDSLSRDRDLGQEQRELLSSLGREIDQLDMNLRDHLVAARNELSFADVALAEVVREAGRLLQDSSAVAGKKIRVDVPGEVLVRADREALKHLFFNLLNNALEASPGGGEVTCGSASSGGRITVWVEDRGQGLMAEAEECLQPFFTTKKNGSGLGLAVCQKIARAHGGLVEIRSRDGGGCRVEVTLPGTEKGEAT